jgi:hypothetical protein
MHNCLIGCTGLVGLHLMNDIKHADYYHSKNIGTILGKTYDSVYFCGLPSTKWLINKNPEKDFDNIKNILCLLKTIKCNKFVLISTIDVYNMNYDGDINEMTVDEKAYSCEAYGGNRRFFEIEIANIFKNVMIFRLPALFGRGLKKNVLFDLLNDNQIENISLNTYFQWYPLENLWQDINKYSNLGNVIINLATEPLKTSDIVDAYFNNKKINCKGTSTITYNMKTLFSSTESSPYMYSKKDIMPMISEYVNFENLQVKKRMVPFVLSVSNLAWSYPDDYIYKTILKRFGINSIEVSFAKFGKWDELQKTISTFKDPDFNYVSCQSVLFDTSLNLFEPYPCPNGSNSELMTHFENILKYCNIFGIRFIVFGSPKQRHIGLFSENDIINRLRSVGDLCEKYGVVFCLEPNSRIYGCTWATTLTETIEWITKINHPYVKLNFDTGNYIADIIRNTDLHGNTNSQRDIEKELSLIDKNIIGNIQISLPYLIPLSNASESDINTIKMAVNILSGKHANISVEMLNVSIYDFYKSMYVIDNLMYFIQVK